MLAAWQSILSCSGVVCLQVALLVQLVLTCGIVIATQAKTLIETKKQQLVEAKMWRKQQEEYEVSY
jgi:uncharacterized membrane protein